MPPELKDYTPKPVEGMTPLSLSIDYMMVETAIDCNMNIKEFELLDWDDQAKLVAYHKVKGLINSFYQEEQERLFESKRQGDK